MATGRSPDPTMLPTTIAVQAAIPRLFSLLGSPIWAIYGVPEIQPLRSSKSVGDEKSPGPITASSCHRRLELAPFERVVTPHWGDRRL